MTLAAVCVVSILFVMKQDELLAVKTDLAKALPVPASTFLRHCRRHHIHSVPHSPSIVATDDYKVEFVYPEDDNDVAILVDEDGARSRVAFPKNQVHKDETIWWDRMSDKNILYHRPRMEILKELWQSKLPEKRE